jgi:SAM-dependent methyltransferase
VTDVVAWAKRLLGNVTLYVALQKAIGADRLRYRCIDELALRPGESVLDVGCGPAYYLDRLATVRYVGFDTSARYIDYARRRWGERATFRCEALGRQHLSELPPIDAVLLLGLLHHLSDPDAAELLDLCAAALAPGGRIISVDTCFEPNQGRVSHWMSANDRGGNVRTPEGFTELALKSFMDVDGEVLTGLTRVPASFWLMRMRLPLQAAGAA